MRTLRRLIFFIVLLALAGVACAHWFFRSSMGNSYIEKKIASRTGLKASVGSARLTFGLSLVMSDLRVWFVSDGDTEETVLSVPEVAVYGHCHNRKVRMARPVITAVQAKRGDWTPSQLRIFVNEEYDFENAIVELAAQVDQSFELVDASIEMKDNTGKILMTCSGVDWSHGPAFVKGHPGMMHDKVVLQCKDGEQVEFSSEWLSDGNRVVQLEAPVKMATLAEGCAASPLATDTEEAVAVPAVQEPEVDVEKKVEAPVVLDAKPIAESVVESTGVAPTNSVPAQAEAPEKD